MKPNLWRNRCIPLLLVFVWVASSETAQAQLALEANFDHGSLLSWSGNLRLINLVGRDNYYDNNKWRWLYFRANGVLGAMPTFSISRNFAGDTTPGLHELEEHEMVYSYDNENWHFFDHNQLGATHYTFSNASPFEQDHVYIAYAIPYSYSRSVQHTAEVLNSPWASPTVSADSDGVIGQSPARIDDIGRSIPPRNLFAYRITNSATDSTTEAKRKVVLASGLHAGEPLGTHTYEGLINWLISDDPRAARLRDIAEFFCYPVLNPAGRFAGMNRTTVGNPERDPNTLWDPSRWSSQSLDCEDNNCQDIRESGEAMMGDVISTPGGVDAMIDFHSTVPDYANPTGLPHDFGFVASEDSDTDWWLEVQRLMAPNVLEYTTSGSGSFTTTGFARRLLGAEVEITFETQFTWERNVDYYHNLGKAFGMAFYNSWVTQVDGDYNGDGVVDALDYTIWRDAFGQSIVAGEGADGDGDGAIGAGDYDVWKMNFGNTAGVSAASRAAQSLPRLGGPTAVPEPATAVSLLLSATCLLACQGRLFNLSARSAATAACL